jgi:hypothetical protein
VKSFQFQEVHIKLKEGDVDIGEQLLVQTIDEYVYAPSPPPNEGGDIFRSKENSFRSIMKSSFIYQRWTKFTELQFDPPRFELNPLNHIKIRI